MQTILVVFHLFLAIGMITLILLQHGKGADAGAAFGSGASATVFGAKGSASFLSRATAIMATLFFVTSLVLAYFASQAGEQKGVMEQTEEKVMQQESVRTESDVPLAPIAVDPGSESDVPVVPTPVE